MMAAREARNAVHV